MRQIGEPLGVNGMVRPQRRLPNRYGAFGIGRRQFRLARSHAKRRKIVENERVLGRVRSSTTLEQVERLEIKPLSKVVLFD
jgi:hypothetical protein